jgi:hypothetical protein
LVPSQLVFLAALLVACDALSGHGLFVPKYQAMDQQPTAIMTGVLVVDDGCIWIESPESGRWLALWPTTISVSTGDPVRVNRYGIEVSEGEPITVGGGPTRSRSTSPLSRISSVSPSRPNAWKSTGS